MSSSCTIFTICWAGLSAPEAAAASARSLTTAVNSRTTGKATSASSNAVRISLTVASTSASESRPLPRRPLMVAARRSERLANTGSEYRLGIYALSAGQTFAYWSLADLKGLQHLQAHNFSHSRAKGSRRVVDQEENIYRLRTKGKDLSAGDRDIGRADCSGNAVQ
ncbi:unannotated protein [freshwater metagenome]|uniref:Unannotated protein n=1 Tax=freshwater metagenome TaxID=449393 RepID=A0A6J7DDY4_9ZZZZ